MKDRFKSLDCNDDVLSFSMPDQAFKLGNFRERVSERFRVQLENYSKGEGFGFISIEGRGIYSSNVVWKSNPIDCEVLKLGAKSWQKGKLIIQVYLERTAVDNRHSSQQKIKLHHVYLEFCPDEPEVEETSASNEIAQPESPLDDLRQMINQETQP